MDRRIFSTLTTVTAASVLLMPGVSAAAKLSPRRTIKPPRLPEGGCIGIVSPGSFMEAEALEQCVRKIEALGFRVKLGTHVLARRGHHAGTVEQRVEDLHAMFADTEVHAIWATRGGYGCSSLLPHLNYALMRRHPKILLGYSDITALHLGIYHHAGLVSFHGPVAWSSFTDFSLQQLRAVLMEPAAQLILPMAPENTMKADTNPFFKARTLHEGLVTGLLLGGNLSVLCALLGTTHMPSLANALLYLEEIGETPKKVDRMLTQLSQTPQFEQIRGVVCGVFDKCLPNDTDPSLSLDEVMDDHFATFKRPAVYGYSFGHIAHQVTLPVGIRARLDTREQTLTLLEPAVT